MSINKFILIGNVTKPLELRYTPNGTPMVTYTVACDDVWYDDKGTKHEDCDFIPVTTLGKQAESDAKWLGKGSAVAVEGRIESWYQPAEKRGGFNFKALRVQYLGRPGAPRRDDEQEGAQQCSGERDDWLLDFEKAEGGHVGASRTN